MPHNFVGCTGSIGYKKTMVSVENSRCVSLTLANSTIVVKKLAQLFDSIANVSPEHVFAKELMEHLAYRTF
jgi:hypothetical protein